MRASSTILPQPESPDVMRGFEVAQKVEEKGAVLLKNDAQPVAAERSVDQVDCGDWRARRCGRDVGRRVFAGFACWRQSCSAAARVAEESAVAIFMDVRVSAFCRR